MRDYRWITDDGRSTPVREMPTSEITGILLDGAVELINPGPGETSEAIMERLRIELVARSMGL